MAALNQGCIKSAGVKSGSDCTVKQLSQTDCGKTLACTTGF